MVFRRCLTISHSRAEMIRSTLRRCTLWDNTYTNTP